MQVFSEMAYERPDMEETLRFIEDSARKAAGADSYEKAREIFLALLEKLRHVSTMETIASIRNTADMTDVFYEKEMEYFHAGNPRLEIAREAFYKVLLESPFLPDFQKEFGEIYFKRMENAGRLTSEKNVELQVEESRLSQQYAKISATCTAKFHGETLNFYGLLKKMQDTDRGVRREAFAAWADLYASVSGQLDEIYSRLIEVRCAMAENLGFSDYVDMAYQKRERFDYGKEDTARFREQIRRFVVPVCQKLFEEQRRRLGLSKLCYYDEALIYPEGNVEPQGTEEEMIAKAGQMYREMSPQTGEFFDFMRRYQLFDLTTRPGKQPGGYCTFLEEEKAPFIFSNFNGTSADVDVLTHEAGHAFEAYTASRQIPLTEQAFSTAEIDEIHSMSMEFFAYPWMNLFFGEKADKYIYAHAADALRVIPYMACVDEFQHRVYQQRLTNPDERYRIWRELEKIYLPWREYDGCEFLEKGGFWMQKQHIFLYPFYYIDYALAQMGAFEYLARMQKNRTAAWEDYLRLCRAGGSRGYFELLKIGNLSNPFAGGTVEDIMKGVEAFLGQAAVRAGM